VVDALQLVRLPYHLSAVTQAVGLAALEHCDELLRYVDALKEQRVRMATGLTDLGYRVYPSDSNFILFGGMRDQSAIWQRLLDASVLVRDVGISGHLRVTVGTPAETTAFLEAIDKITKEPAA
jgi:histidinol-phosphate aminotransferase